jgi:signal transduction histidine kinase
MLLLPALVASDEQSSSGGAPSDVRLPMSDAAAAALAEALVDASDEAVEKLARHLASEPGLTLWSVWRLAREQSARAATFDDLARRLLTVGARRLQWSGDDRTADNIAPERPQKWRSLFEASIERVEIGRAASKYLNLVDDPTAIIDLLHNADGWLREAAGQNAGEAGDLLPRWLTEAVAARKPAISASFEELDEAERRAARRHAAAAWQRWTAAGSLGSDFLPRLNQRLQRLHQLETAFAAALEIEKLEAMAEFAAGAGHEINNPLAVISGRAQLLVRDERDPERRRDLALIHTQAMRVYEMIADMMLAARPPQPELTHVELGELLSKLVDNLQAKAQLRQIELRYWPPVGPLMVQADPTQLTVALRALCDNAFEAIGGNGWVEVSVRQASDVRIVQIVVRDNGPGISGAVRRHLFDPYFSGREAGRGLGVGLAKCRAIVLQHGGDLVVDSAPGAGATFTITLRRIETERQREGETERKV